MKRIYLLCLPLLCITFSYQTPDFDEQAEIAAAQAWYESNHSGAVFLDQSLQPDWNGTQVVRPKSDRLLIDVPLTGGNQFTYTSNNTSNGQITNETRYGATRLVITKFGENQYIPLLLHVFGTPAYTNEFGQAAAAANRPHNIQSNFTGHMVYTQLDGEAFYGLYIENGQVIASLTPEESGGSISRGCSLEEICMGYFESLICITFVLCEVNEGGGGSWTTIGGGGENVWWTNGPIEHCIGCLGGGFTPPTCPDGSPMSSNGECLCPDGTLMPSNGECESESPYYPTFCTKLVGLTPEIFTCLYTGVAYPGDNCNLIGHVQFSDSTPWWETLGTSITHSSASGVIPSGGGMTGVTFTWTVTFGLDPLVNFSTQSASDNRELYFDMLCCPN